MELMRAAWIPLLIAAVASDSSHHQKPCPDTCSCTNYMDGMNIQCSTFPANVPPTATSLTIWNAEMPTLSQANLNGPGIHTLTIINCGIEVIKSDAFHSLPGLRSLRLSRNNFTTLDAGTFLTNVQLEDLFLDHNQLDSISAAVFNPIQNLRVLDLHGNQLTTIPAGLPSSLVQLNLANNQLSDDQDLPMSLPDLTTLNLCGNDLMLTTMSYPKLRVLCAGEVDVNASLSWLTGLTDLTLRAKMGGNATLDERHAAQLANLTQLESLHIHSYRLQNLRFLKNLSHLRLLELQYITGVQDIAELSTMSSLLYLDLEGSPNLQKSLISDIPKSLQNLRYLSMSNTSIDTLPIDIFNKFPHLATIDLSFNPIVCSCLMSMIPDKIHSSKLALDRSDRTLCNSPPEMKGKLFEKGDFCSSKTSQAIVTISTTLGFEAHKQEYIIVGSILGGLLLILFVVAMYLHYTKQKAFFRTSNGKTYFSTMQPLKRSPSADSLI